MGVTIDELVVADQAEAWEAVGFEVADGVCLVGEVRIRLTGAGEGGLTGWSLRGIAGTELDGLPTTTSDPPAPEQPVRHFSPSGRQMTNGTHPNGVVGLDHVVAITPDLERTVAALEEAGLDLRRVREEPTPAGAPRQAFFRLGAVILEVVQEPAEVAAQNGPDRPAFFWGLAFSVPDIEAAAAMLGERASEVREAVQPGRRILSLRRIAGLALPVAMITPRPERT